jgi:hypothetical protein
MTEQQQAHVGSFSRRHVSGMLKHLVDEEQKVKAQEVAAVYKRMFAEKKWEAVLAKMQGVVDEDHLRVVGKRRPAPLLSVGETWVTTPSTRVSTASSEVSTGRTRATETPREPWDVTSGGPTTPLSPTPTGNAFAVGGFWEGLSPATPVPHTPLTAAPPSPYSPIVPLDNEARKVYNHVKDDVEAMARTVCASRWSAYSTITDSNDVPISLVRSKDVLRGAEMTIQCRQVDLVTAINPHLPKLLEGLAHEEKKITDMYSVKDTPELLDLDMWLHVDEETLEFTTLLDSQRELIRMHRDRRKTKAFKLSDRAIQQAWATRILEDAERNYQEDSDGSSTHSGENIGYDYNNFLRSIKSATSSSSDLASMSDYQSRSNLTSMRSSSSIHLSRETTFESIGPLRSPFSPSLRSSASPKKPSHASLLRSRENSVSQSPSPEKLTQAVEELRSRKSSLLQSQTSSPEKVRSSPLPQPRKSSLSDSPSPDKPSHAHQLCSQKSSLPQNLSVLKAPNRVITFTEEAVEPPPRPPERPSHVRQLHSQKSNLSQISSSAKLQALGRIITITEETVEPPLLSPEDRRFRRMAASHTDLTVWAEELRKMEEHTAANMATQHSSTRHVSQEGIIEHVREDSSDSLRQDALESLNNSITPKQQWFSDLSLRQNILEHSNNSIPPKQQWLSDLPLRRSNAARPPRKRISPPKPNFVPPLVHYIPLNDPKSPSTRCPPTRAPTTPQHTPWPSSPDYPPPPPPRPPPPPVFTHPGPSQLSLHDAVRRKQHVKTKSEILREEIQEDEWRKELKRMESRERIRQEDDRIGWKG